MKTPRPSRRPRRSAPRDARAGGAADRNRLPPLAHRVWKILRALIGETPPKRLLIALSGGPDSMTLAHLLGEIRDVKESGWRLEALHCDHDATSESAATARRVMKRAKALRLKARTLRLPQRQGNQRSPEEHFRIERYQTLAAQARAGDVLLTGHTRDDRVENVLLRLFRGVHAAQFPDLTPHRELPAPWGKLPLLRPMLTVTRREIDAYVERHGLICELDPWNEKGSLPRNWLRRTLLPLLRAEHNPKIDEALLRFADSLPTPDLRAPSAEYGVRNAEYAEGSSTSTPKSEIRGSSEVFPLPQDPQEWDRRTPAFQQWLHNAGCPCGKLLRAHYDALKALTRKPRHGFALDLPGGYALRLERGYRLVLLGPNPARIARSGQNPQKTPK